MNQVTLSDGGIFAVGCVSPFSGVLKSTDLRLQNFPSDRAWRLALFGVSCVRTRWHTPFIISGA